MGDHKVEPILPALAWVVVEMSKGHITGSTIHIGIKAENAAKKEAWRRAELDDDELQAERKRAAAARYVFKDGDHEVHLFQSSIAYAVPKEVEWTNFSVGQPKVGQRVVLEWSRGFEGESEVTWTQDGGGINWKDECVPVKWRPSTALR